ncbi:MAG: CHAD domain-containing protein [Methylocystis sp.]|uniref:CHAD domain-containing protein n=1 Tax=Methylocystis sp. TaxID=1911079 RepID=UPI003DA63396
MNPAEPTPPLADESHAPADESHARAREVEVKLEGAPEVLAGLFEHGLVAAAAPRAQDAAAPRAQDLETAYFDTADDALERAGLSLRLRRSGAGRVMTLKWTPQDESVFSRGEVERAIDSDAPDPSRFPPEIAAMIERAAGGAPLVWRFETRVRRRLAACAAGASRLEIAVDEGEIRAAAGREPIAECEVELKGGAPADLFQFAARLTRAGLWLSPAQKSQRGYRLARGERLREVPATAPRVAPGADAEAALRVTIDVTLRQFVGNWPAFLGSGDAAALAQMRLALRRLRAALGLYETALPAPVFAPFRADARRIAAALAPVRELDAVIARLSRKPSADGAQALLATARGRRRRACEAARDALRAGDASRFVLDLQALAASSGWREGLDAAALERLKTPARAFIAQALERRLKRARRSVDDILAATPEERRRLRLRLCALRQAADVFGGVFEDDLGVATFNSALRALEAALGAQGRAEGEAGPAALARTHAPRGDSELAALWRACPNAPAFWR